MGGTPSKRKGADEYLAMECVAKYMSITKQQIIDLRNRCYMSMDSKRKINRRSFNNNVKLCKIKESPDGEILDCLFTMWDLQVDESILVPPFILSLAPLACRNEDFKNILTFSLSVFERETEGELSAEQVVFILKRKFLFATTILPPWASFTNIVSQFSYTFRHEPDCFILW